MFNEYEVTEVYKVLKIDMTKETVTVIGVYPDTTDGKEQAEMALYLDKMDEPAPDKDKVFKWLLVKCYS